MRTSRYLAFALCLVACDDAPVTSDDAATAADAFTLDSTGLNRCTGLTDCRIGEVCHRSGVCVQAGFCVDNADCAAGQVCGGASHRCVQAGRCMVEGDCPTGQRCSAGSHMCLVNGRCGGDADCSGGQRCDTATGQCVIGMGCGRTVFSTTRLAPNVMIVLDRSGSMSEPADGTTRWDLAKRAIQAVTTRFDTTIRFGLATFSACLPGGCSAGRVVVPIADRNASRINGFLAPLVARGSADGSSPNYLCDTAFAETSTGVTLQGLVGNAMLQDTSRANAVLLVTDGGENPECTGTGRPAGPVAAGNLFRQAVPVRTYAVGMSGDTNPDQLRAIATAGNTTRFYQANNSADLIAALNTIAQDLGSCDMMLNGSPPDSTMIYVYFNRMPVAIPADPTNGWTYDPSTHTLHFHGTSCNQIRGNTVMALDVVYGCDGGVPG